MEIKLRASINNKGLDTIIDNTSANVITRQIALVGEQIMVDESPVDTGVLRANWFVSPRQGEKPLNRKRHKPSNPKPSPELFIQNNVGYAGYANITSYRPYYIEKGISKILEYARKLKITRRGISG